MLMTCLTNSVKTLGVLSADKQSEVTMRQWYVFKKMSGKCLKVKILIFFFSKLV